MKILAAIIAHPLRKVAGATNAARELTAATARLTDIELAIMWDRDSTVVEQGLTTHYLRCFNRLGPLAGMAPRFASIPLYDSRLPEMVEAGAYDLVHIHNLIPAFAAERLTKACRRRGIPYVISSHGFFELSRYAEINGFGTVKSRLVDLAITQPFRRMVEGAAAIFALSEFDREVLSGMGLRQDRFRIVTNGVNEFFLEPPLESEMAAVRRKWLAGDGPVLLFFGSLHAYKGVGVFLRSLREISGPFRAVVAGRFKHDSERLALLDGAGLSADLASRVIFTGGVSNEELRALYHSADLFVYPTMGDTLPLVVLEAMACGRAVISTTVGGIAFEVPPECGVLVPPNDSGAVGRAVRDLLAAPEAARLMGRKGRIRVETTFRWGLAAQAAVAGYESVLRPSGARRLGGAVYVA
jgi:glycosyltransferase involved in cell wall biosynthesis